MEHPQEGAVLEQIATLRARLEELEARVTRRIADGSQLDIAAVLACRVGNERFAVSLTDVDAAVRMCALIQYPEAPPWIPGLLNYHAQLVPIIDIRARIDRRSSTARLSDLIVLCHRGQGLIGLIVDEVLRIHALDPACARPVPHELPSAPYVRAIVDLDGVAAYVLDIACLAATSSVPEPDGVHP